MIVTVATVVVFVIGVLSLGLAMYGGYVSLSITDGLKGNQEERHAAEQRYYLLGMIGIIVLTARLLNVPILQCVPMVLLMLAPLTPRYLLS